MHTTLGPVRSFRRQAFLAALLSLCCASASAAELEYGVDVGIGTSDNIARTPSGEIDETMATAGADLRWQREGRLDADVELDLSYLDYAEDTYDSEVIGGADAYLAYGIVPERFEWVLQDSFGQMELDPFAAATPENREDVNYVTTGPDVRFRLGSAAELLVFGRYSATMYENSNLDDKRRLAGFSLSRQASARGTFSLNLITQRVEFDEDNAASNYDRQSAYLGYEATGARTRLTANIGYTALHDFGETRDSPLVELEVERDLSPTSLLSFEGGVNSSDSAEALRSDEIYGGESLGPGRVAIGEPFETRYLGLGWVRRGQRTFISLSARWLEDVYEMRTDLNRTRTTLEAILDRRLSRNVRAHLVGSFDTNDYDNAGYDDDETRFGAGLSWNLTGHVYLELDADWYDHQSSDAATEFDETRVFLRLAWRSRAEP